MVLIFNYIQWKYLLVLQFKITIMIFKIRTKGHKNVSSMHKSTFEITKDPEIGPTADLSLIHI